MKTQKQTSTSIEFYQYAEEEKKSLNKLLESSFFCQYKVQLIKTNIAGEISDFEKMQLEIKNRVMTDYIQQLRCLNFSYQNNSIFESTSPAAAFDNNVTYIFTKSSITFDFIEKLGNLLIPVYVSATSPIPRWMKIFLTCQSLILKRRYTNTGDYGKIIFKENDKIKILKVRFSSYEKDAKIQMESITHDCSDFCLSKQCKVCEYSSYCFDKAIQSDHLSLLSKIVSKKVEYYEKKGIFTLTQLSYLYRPRRKKKAQEKAVHNIELQALAIRTNKIHIKHPPSINRTDIELFIDIEGLPNSDFYYLIGIVVKSNNSLEYVHFWANNKSEEVKMWHDFLVFIESYPNANLYHYGNFEVAVFKKLKTKYKTKNCIIEERMINLNSMIYGKIYFPVYSNDLKSIGKYLGATWIDKKSDGIQSIVWRYKWENGEEDYKSKLINYNSEDCYALLKLIDKLTELRDHINSNSISSSINFVDNIKKQTSENSKVIHTQFNAILKYASEDYEKKKFSLQHILNAKTSGDIKSHKGVSRKIPKTKNSKQVMSRKICPVHKIKLNPSKRTQEWVMTDIVFTKNSIRKQVIKYYGYKAFCPECSRYYPPPQIEKRRHFGHNFLIWILYQRMFLRLPYNVIQSNMEELFNEHMSSSTTSSVLNYFSEYYKFTDKLNLRKILNSPFIHADETIVNVRGDKQYVWILTNGNEVVFRLTKTRESIMIKDILKNYTGVLISDFYAGYDSLKCKQQKCWVHLIRDMNDDLWKNPFDIEYENFVIQVKELMFPIFESIDKYGLKSRHFNKFKKNIEVFYVNISETQYKSEISQKYQTRFFRYKEKLFTFLNQDGIPWNNNMGERGLRHIAVQRKISTFFSDGINNYLLLLGIMQTCRFKEKSFLSFLKSRKKTI
jgi:predicted RecB family nuclease